MVLMRIIATLYYIVLYHIICRVARSSLRTGKGLEHLTSFLLKCYLSVIILLYFFDYAKESSKASSSGIEGEVRIEIRTRMKRDAF